MTIHPYTPPTEAVPTVTDYQSRAVVRLGEWAHTADAAYAVAQRLVQSSFVPVAFRGKPIEATAAILAGSEVGLAPMAALRAFDVIQGQAAPRALTLRAIAQSYGHDVEVIESTSTRCRVRARRRGGDWQTVTWTLDRAREMQLLSKDNWRKQPGAMLVARATSEAARLVAADAILGIGYSAEEIADGGTPDMAAAAESVDSSPAGMRRMSRATLAAAPAAEPVDVTDAEVLPEESPYDPEAITPAQSTITPAQSRAMHAAFRDLGISDRDLRLDYCRNVIGRDLGSSKDLTAAEASHILAALAADTPTT